MEQSKSPLNQQALSDQQRQRKTESKHTKRLQQAVKFDILFDTLWTSTCSLKCFQHLSKTAGKTFATPLQTTDKSTGQQLIQYTRGRKHSTERSRCERQHLLKENCIVGNHQQHN